MKKDFQIDQGNALVKGKSLYDLYNFYEYAGCLLTNVGRFYVLFEPDPIHGKGQIPVAIECDDVDFLEFSPGFLTGTVMELVEMGYKAPIDQDDNWLLREEQATEADHLFLRFEGNAFVRIHSKRASLLEGFSMRWPGIDRHL